MTDRFESKEFKGFPALVNKEQGIVVLTIPSSKEGSTYDVTMFTEDDTAHCDCKGFEYRNSCRHVLLVRTLLAKGV